jgi:transposase InsO family protein
MRHTAAEKMEIIRLVEGSELPVKRTLQELNVARSSFYRWYRAYREHGLDGLTNRTPSQQRFWNRIPEAERRKVVQIALEKPELSPRELAWHITDTEGTFISESSVYRILKAFDLVTSPNFIVMAAAKEFRHPTCHVHELWQTDFTYLRVVGWGWYYLSTVLDDFSRYIIAWKLCTTMATDDVQALLDVAVARTGVDRVRVHHRPRLLSDNGPCYVSQQLKEYLLGHGMSHTRGKPYHPMTQGKIERYHRSLKNVVKLQNYYSPWELERELARFVDHYNNHRVHESLDNLTPADVYFGRRREILTAREKLKRETLRRRRRYNNGLPLRKEEMIRPAEIRELSLNIEPEMSHSL